MLKEVACRHSERYDGLMVIMLDSGSSSLVLSPWWGPCVMFLGFIVLWCDTLVPLMVFNIKFAYGTLTQA